MQKTENYEILSVSHVQPVCNRNGKVSAWMVSVQYKIPDARYNVTKSVEYEFYNLFGFGWHRAWQFRLKCLGRMSEQKHKEI